MKSSSMHLWLLMFRSLPGDRLGAGTGPVRALIRTWTKLLVHVPSWLLRI